MDALDRMQTFVAIVDTGSLSAAARRVARSVAAVSRQLTALEAELGTPLIVRSTRRLRVTAPGQRWYAHCTRLLRELDDARADVAEQRAPRGRVVVSAPVSIGSWYVAPRLAELARRHPGLELELRLEDHVIDLVSDAVDIAVRGGIAPPDTTAVIAHPVLAFRRVVVASPGYLRRAGVPRHPTELAQHDGVIQAGPLHAVAAWQLCRGDEVCEVAPRARLRSTAPLVLRSWAVAGAGVALLPAWLHDPADRALRRVLDGWESATVRAWAIHRTELRGAPRIRATVAALGA